MTSLSPAEAHALARIDGLRPAMLAEIEAWAAINTGSRNLAGLAQMADVLEAAFAPLGGTATRVAAASASQIDAGGNERPLLHGDNLHIVKRGYAPVRVLLTGHMDTVFPADHGFQACRWLDADTLNGPGVADMKGGIAVIKAALTALEASPFGEAIGWEVILNSDEEVSSPGSAPLLAEAARRCHLGLTFEPALPDGTLAGARAGFGQFFPPPSTAAPPMPGATRLMAATRCWRQPIWRCSGCVGWRRSVGEPGQDRRRRGPITSCPIMPCCAGTCGRALQRPRCARKPASMQPLQPWRWRMTCMSTCTAALPARPSLWMPTSSGCLIW